MASQSKTQQAIENTLILSCIFEHLSARHRYKTLVKCMGVSKLWEKEARSVLFRRVGYTESDRELALRRNFMIGPDLFDVIYMDTSLERKQLYAQSIRSIKIDATPPADLSILWDGDQNLLRKLDLSSVQEVQIDDPTVWELSSIYCPIYMCQNIWRLIINDQEASPELLAFVERRFENLRHLEIVPYILEEMSEVVRNLPLLETLNLGVLPQGEDEFRLFKVVAQHEKLQSVRGLPVERLWIYNVSRIQTSPWFRSIKHIGANPSFHIVEAEADMDDFAGCLELLAQRIPNLVSLEIQTYTDKILETLATLDQIQELEIYPMRMDHPPRLTVSEILGHLQHMTKLRVLRFPRFHRCRKYPIPPWKPSVNVSWKTVEEFTERMPNLEELSFYPMHLNGMTPGYAPGNLDYSPVIWRRNLGWEIMDWDIASVPFQAAMGHIGKYMPHDYFGPYHDDVEFLHEWIDEGREGWETDDDEVWKENSRRFVGLSPSSSDSQLVVMSRELEIEDE